MRWIVYYTATIILNAASLLVLHRHIHITATSIAPVLLLLLSAFLAFYFQHYREKEFNTAYSVGTDITDAEWKQVTIYMAYSHLISIPLYFPFVWFFSSWVKMFSVLLFLIAFVGGGIVFRVKCGKEIQGRYDKEKRELQEQKKKEEMGQWK